MGQKIRDLMTTELAKLEGDRSVAEAALLMRDMDVGDVLVTRAGKLAGIVTDRDIVVRCIAQNGDAGTTPLERVLTSEVATLSPDADADEAVKLMQDRAIRRIPVVENGEPLGVLSIGDLAVERDGRSALGRISAAPPNR